MESQDDEHAILQHLDAAKEQSLADDQRRYGHVHRIAHVAIQPADYQVDGRRDGRGRTQALHGEAVERVDQHGKANTDQQRAKRAKGDEAQQRRRYLPSADPVRKKDSEAPRRNHQKNSRPENGRRLFHSK